MRHSDNVSGTGPPPTTEQYDLQEAIRRDCEMQKEHSTFAHHGWPDDFQLELAKFRATNFALRTQYESTSDPRYPEERHSRCQSKPPDSYVEVSTRPSSPSIVLSPLAPAFVPSITATNTSHRTMDSAHTVNFSTPSAAIPSLSPSPHSRGDLDRYRMPSTLLYAPARTSAMNPDLITKVQALEDMCKTQAKQLATQGAEITMLKDQSDFLHSIYDEEGGALESLAEGLDRTNSKFSHLDEQMLELRSQSRGQAQAPHDTVVPAKNTGTQLEKVTETQKMQGTSIVAVTGQVGTLDRLVQVTVDTLTKDIKELSAQVSEQQQVFADLRPENRTGSTLRDEVRGLTSLVSRQAEKIEALDSDRQAAKEALDDYERDKYIMYRQAKEFEEYGERYHYMNEKINMVQEAVSKANERLYDVRVQLDRMQTTCNSDASTHGDASDQQNELQAKVNSLQADMLGIRRRAQQHEIGMNTTLAKVQSDMSDLVKRADESVIVADARSAALEARVVELSDKLSTPSRPLMASTAASPALDVASTGVAEVMNRLRTLESSSSSLAADVGSLEDHLDVVAAKVSSAVGKSEFEETREFLSKELMGIKDTMRDLQVRLQDAAAGRLSEEERKQVLASLKELRFTTAELAQACAVQGKKTDTLHDKMRSLIDDRILEIRDTQAEHADDVTAALSKLRQDFEASRAEHEEKIAIATAQNHDQATLTQDSVRGTDDFNRRVDEALAARDLQTPDLTSPVDDISAQRYNSDGINQADPDSDSVTSRGDIDTDKPSWLAQIVQRLEKRSNVTMGPSPTSNSSTPSKFANQTSDPRNRVPGPQTQGDAAQGHFYTMPRLGPSATNAPANLRGGEVPRPGGQARGGARMARRAADSTSGAGVQGRDGDGSW